MADFSPEPVAAATPTTPKPDVKATPKSKAKPRAAPKTPTKTPTKSKDADGLTPREMELLVGALTNLKDDARIQVNYEAMAGATGLKDGNSAKASWAGLRKKLNMTGGIGSTPSAGSPEKPAGVTKSAKKTKQPLKAAKKKPTNENEDNDKVVASSEEPKGEPKGDAGVEGQKDEATDDAVKMEDGKEEREEEA
ncbi:hypothetical protein PV10_06475 [Exophiala mesophila]|uniref:Uncharacterized protein n=1 Tax=Exophiala mesophila TaxID=212818 RepID=A0A0D1ZYS7_EXOME|nr:uncharacterized protein PV10_06475 [Exophiala mesophila]KIV91993.1 hypothetical protein PV10_06475 [Exophiala mesophila]